MFFGFFLASYEIREGSTVATGNLLSEEIWILHPLAYAFILSQTCHGQKDCGCCAFSFLSSMKEAEASQTAFSVTARPQ